MEFALFLFFAFPSSIPIILDPMVYRLLLADSFMLLLLEEDLTCESVLCCGVSELDIWLGLIKGEVLHCYIYNKKTR